MAGGIWSSQNKIQPGTYTLNTSMSSKKMLQILNEKTEEEGDKTS